MGGTAQRSARPATASPRPDANATPTPSRWDPVPLWKMTSRQVLAQSQYCSRP